MKTTTTITIDVEVKQLAKQRYGSGQLSQKIESLLRADLDLPAEKDETVAKDQMKRNAESISVYKARIIELEQQQVKVKKKSRIVPREELNLFYEPK